MRRSYKAYITTTETYTRKLLIKSNGVVRVNKVLCGGKVSWSVCL